MKPWIKFFTIKMHCLFMLTLLGSAFKAIPMEQPVLKKNAGFAVEGLLEAVKSNDVQLAKYWHNFGVPLTTCDEDGRTLIEIAQLHGPQTHRMLRLLQLLSSSKNESSLLQTIGTAISSKLVFLTVEKDSDAHNEQLRHMVHEGKLSSFQKLLKHAATDLSHFSPWMSDSKVCYQSPLWLFVRLKYSSKSKWGACIKLLEDTTVSCKRDCYAEILLTIRKLDYQAVEAAVSLWSKLHEGEDIRNDVVNVERTYEPDPAITPIPLLIQATRAELAKEWANQDDIQRKSLAIAQTLLTMHNINGVLTIRDLDDAGTHGLLFLLQCFLSRKNDVRPPIDLYETRGISGQSLLSNAIWRYNNGDALKLIAQDPAIDLSRPWKSGISNAVYDCIGKREASSLIRYFVNRGADVNFVQQMNIEYSPLDRALESAVPGRTYDHPSMCSCVLALLACGGETHKKKLDDDALISIDMHVYRYLSGAPVEELGNISFKAKFRKFCFLWAVFGEKSASDYCKRLDRVSYENYRSTPLDKVNSLDEGENCVDSVNSRDIAGCTPLMWAAARGRLDLATFLKELGAHLDVQDAYGDTALHYAVRSNHPAMVCHLLNRGAKSIENNDKQTPFTLARTCKRELILKLFELRKNCRLEIMKCLTMRFTFPKDLALIIAKLWQL
jgi:hypothetical protein